jgi:hypothetical protein
LAEASEEGLGSKWAVMPMMMMMMMMMMMLFKNNGRPPHYTFQVCTLQ